MRIFISLIKILISVCWSMDRDSHIC